MNSALRRFGCHNFQPGIQPSQGNPDSALRRFGSHVFQPGIQPSQGNRRKWNYIVPGSPLIHHL
jgi:hypothetical protein